MTDILVVEDNKELAGVLCDFLRAENYTVSAAENAEKALLLYEKYGARLVVLDIMLPDKDGLYILEKIRADSNTPVLIVSAKTSKEDKLSGLNLGADDYIEKPYDIDIMLAKIGGIFKRRYSLDELSDGNIRINKINRIVYRNDLQVEMTAKEFDRYGEWGINLYEVLEKNFRGSHSYYGCYFYLCEFGFAWFADYGKRQTVPR